MPILEVAPRGGREECLLDLGGQRPARAASDRLAVHLADGRHFDGCAREERFVGGEQIVHLDCSDFNREAQIAGDFDYRIARDPQQDRVPCVVGQKLSPVNQEDVFSRSFGNRTVGGEQQGVGGKIGFAVLGLWHGVLQVAVPLLLVRVGSWRAWLAAMLTVLVFAVVGNQLARRGLRWLLLVAWLAHGVLVLWLPFALREAAFSTDAQAHVLKLVVAALLGGLMSCVWLGWYMAVSLEFNGHYSEAGGAARIEEYKEFVRIRLTKNTLTAYVVAVDQPLSNGADLKMKIVDVFQLRASE